MELQEYDVKVVQTGHFTIMASSQEEAYEKLYDMDPSDWKKQADWDETELDEVY